MKSNEWSPLFHEYAYLVVNQLRTDALLLTFSELSQLIADRIHRMDEWQIALPMIACQSIGGSLENGIVIASAWVCLELASEILDNIEDKEFTVDQFLTSPEVASNLTSGLLFYAFNLLTSIDDPRKSGQIIKLFTEYGFNAVNGQHLDLTQQPVIVEQYLEKYWEIIILKSGSVFRAATEGAAVARDEDEMTKKALGDYGTALGVMLQLLDDCRDAFNHSQNAVKKEISLPLLLYLMTIEEKSIIFPDVNSQAEWSTLLQTTGVVHAISEILLSWKSRALESLSSLPQSREKFILESIPSLFLEKIPSMANEVRDETNT